MKVETLHAATRLDENNDIQTHSSSTHLLRSSSTKGTVEIELKEKREQGATTATTIAAAASTMVVMVVVR